MKINTIVCDGCEKPIANLKHSIEFAPLRGGLSIIANDQKTEGDKTTDLRAELKITDHRHFCATECVGKLIAKLAEKAKPVAEEKQPVAPAAAKK